MSCLVVYASYPHDMNCFESCIMGYIDSCEILCRLWINSMKMKKHINIKSKDAIGYQNTALG